MRSKANSTLLLVVSVAGNVLLLALLSSSLGLFGGYRQLALQSRSSITLKQSLGSRRDTNASEEAISVWQAPSKYSTGYTKALPEHPACKFFRSNAKRHDGKERGSEAMWGPARHVCMDESSAIWLQRSRSNCYSCIDPTVNVCNNPPVLEYHMSLTDLHKQKPEANLLAIQAFLMTQDLTQSKLTLWYLGQREQVYTNVTAWLFDAFSDYITLKPFVYSELIKGTVWEHDSFLGNETLVKQYLWQPACYSDPVRIILMHKFGGVWFDNDVIFYQDLTHTFQTSYQFIMRWTNPHVMRFLANSPLTQRMLKVATQLPANHPNFWEEVINKKCKPYGWMAAHPMYKGMDVYNSCLLRLLLRVNNTGPANAVLYDMPLGWWDQEWAGCKSGDSRKGISDADWRQLANTYLAMHNRYPKYPDPGPSNSTMQRAIRIISGFFDACKSPDCLPLEGAPLLAYEGLYDIPPEAKVQRRRLFEQRRRSLLAQPTVGSATTGSNRM